MTRLSRATISMDGQLGLKSNVNGHKLVGVGLELLSNKVRRDLVVGNVGTQPAAYRHALSGYGVACGIDTGI